MPHCPALPIKSPPRSGPQLLLCQEQLKANANGQSKRGHAVDFHSFYKKPECRSRWQSENGQQTTPESTIIIITLIIITIIIISIPIEQKPRRRVRVTEREKNTIRKSGHLPLEFDGGSRGAEHQTKKMHLCDEGTRRGMDSR